ncbi:MAG: hypothetical protein LUC27_00935 [Lachnospiraceae bacterium]|nr:hypothetical protein [Lachnospiraceae bacterium]
MNEREQQRMDLPQVCRELIRTETSYPFSAADRLVEPICLADYGFVEKEYLVTGHSNVYRWKADGVTPEVKIPDVPYGSRLLVRRPGKPEDFQGIVVVELMNWASFYDRSIPGWGHCYEYYLEHGIAWVGLAIRDKALEAMQRFDPQRYAELGFKNPVPAEEREEPAYSYGKKNTDPENENGLIWDFISQTGVLLKTQTPENPLYGFDVKKVMMTGATAGDTSLYACSIEPYHRMPDGVSPIYDGFLVYMTGAPGELSQCERKFDEWQERCKFYCEVPYIHVLTCGDMGGEGWHPDWAVMQRRPDADEPGKKFHSYEIAGCGVRAGYDKLRCVCQEDVEKSRTPWRDSVNYEYEFPIRYILRRATEELILWMTEGIEPPHGPKLLFDDQPYPQKKMLRDELGHAQGGVRLPYVEAPLYRFDEQGGATRLPDETILQMYEDRDDYLRKFITSAVGTVRDGFVLPEDGVEMILEAIHETFPEKGACGE